MCVCVCARVCMHVFEIMIVVTNHNDCSSIQTREANRDGDFDRACKRSLYTLLCNAFSLIGVELSIIFILTILLVYLNVRKNLPVV